MIVLESTQIKLFPPPKCWLGLHNFFLMLISSDCNVTRMKSLLAALCSPLQAALFLVKKEKENFHEPSPGWIDSFPPGEMGRELPPCSSDAKSGSSQLSTMLPFSAFPSGPATFLGCHSYPPGCYCHPSQAPHPCMGQRHWCSKIQIS